MAKMVLARSRKKEAGWRKHIKAQAGSGLPIAAYCRQHDLRAHGFYWWRRELTRRDVDQPAAFVPVTVAAAILESASAGQW
jgi:transposase-like protein